MKTTIKLLALLIIALPINLSAQKYSVELKVKKGDTFTQNQTVDSRLSQQAMGQSMNILSKTTTKCTYKVAEVKGDLIHLDYIIDHVRMDIDQMGQKMVIDSEVESNVPGVSEVAAIYRAVTGVPVTFIVNKKGELKEIKGAEKFEGAIDEALKDMNPMQRDQLKAQFAQEFSEEKLRNSFEQSFSFYFPEAPIAVGDSWENKSVINQSQIELDVAAKNTLISVRDNIATFRTEGDVGSKDKVHTQEANGMTIKMTMTGKQNGTVMVDLNTGMVKELISGADFEAESEVMGMKIPQTISVTTKIIAL